MMINGLIIQFTIIKIFKINKDIFYMMLSICKNTIKA